MFNTSAAGMETPTKAIWREKQTFQKNSAGSDSYVAESNEQLAPTGYNAVYSEGIYVTHSNTTELVSENSQSPLTALSTHAVSENATNVALFSFDSFVPLSDLDPLATELVPIETDRSLLHNQTWNKTEIDRAFNFTANLSVSDWNTTETSQSHQTNWLLLALCIIPTWILFGNLLVLLAVIYHRNLRTLSNLVIASLAVTDFLLALIVVPFGTYQVVSV